jgi:hypothetical protein
MLAQEVDADETCVIVVAADLIFGARFRVEGGGVGCGRRQGAG